MAAPVARQRGSIRRRARCWEIRVSAGEDPSTGERIVLVDSVQIEGDGERAERTAYKQAEKVRTRLLADADELKVARTKATVGALLERFMAQHEVDETTRMNYASQIRRYIEPKLGDVPLVLFVREAAQRLEPWYAQLRRCGALCNGRSFIERVAVGGPGRSPWRGGRVAVGGPRSGGRCGAARRELRPCVRGMILKDTKSHQMRRVSIDAPTVDLLPAAGRQRRLPTLRSRERGYRWSSTP